MATRPIADPRMFILLVSDAPAQTVGAAARGAPHGSADPLHLAILDCHEPSHALTGYCIYKISSSRNKKKKKTEDYKSKADSQRSARKISTTAGSAPLSSP
jgi:hypothetical protein